MNKLIKALIIALMLSLMLTLCVFASDYSDLKEQLIGAGISAELLGAENEIVSSEIAENIILDLTGKKIEFSGENAVTSEYLTALLELKGFSADRGDFLSAFPFDKAAEVGLIKNCPDSSYYLTNRTMIDAALNVAEASAYSANFPSINESGNIVGLFKFYSPLVSEDIVQVFADNDDLRASESSKFSVSVAQGGGSYISGVFRQDGVDLEDLSLKFDPYFAAVSFYGKPITVNVSINADIENGYSVYSNKGTPSASYENGVVSIVVDQAQILKVVFDGAVGKTLYVLVGYKNALEAFDVEVMLKNGINTVINTGYSENVTNAYPVKTIVDNNIVYYKSYYSNGNAYLSLNLYEGVYNKDDAISYKGDLFVPVEAFAGNGVYENALYDRESGTILLETENVSNATISGFKSAKESVLSESGNTVSFYDSADTASNGIFAKFEETTLFNAKCLKLMSFSSMTGKASGAKVTLAMLGYDSSGKTDIIASSDIRAYNKSYNTTSYFDISSADGEYEGFYFAIMINEAPGVTITMSGIELEIFEVSSGVGDNEFNPF